MTDPTQPAAEPGPAPARRPRRLSVRGHLAVFTAGLVLPIVVFVGFLLYRFAAVEQARLEQDAAELATALALSVDRDTTGLLASLEVLSLSAYLQAGDLEGFHRQSRVLASRQEIVPVVTELPSRRQLANARVPWGSALPATNLPFGPAELESGRPFVTDLFRGLVSGDLVFGVGTVVRRDGADPWLLTFTLSPERLARILAEAEIAPQYTASIVDRSGTIMARNVRAAEFVGKPASRDLQEAATGQAGTWQGTTVDGTPVFAAYARSRLTGFRAAVGIRHVDLNAPLWRSLSLFAAVGLTIAALSTILGLLFGQRITAPIRALARQAVRLGRGEPVTPLATGLKEADEVALQLVQASAARLRRETELRDANEEIQRFAYVVSHDLRSPLVNIMGFTTELQALRQDTFRRLEALRGTADGLAERNEDRRLGEDFDEAIGFIKASIGKMDRLIAAVLKLSREGRREFRPERIDMNALVETVRASLAHQAEAAGATIVAGKLQPITSDRLAVEQIVSNLVENAVKYLRSDVPGRIEITSRDAGSAFVYEVRDNGRGIDPKDRERVFELFRRSGSQDRPGEGIGLAHVRALVRRLGGSIALTSTPGQGSVFSVTLPRRWSADSNQEAA